jgi:hypothetical protein
MERETLLTETLQLRARLREVQSAGDALRASAARAAAEAEAVGKALVCPITQAPFVDPVTCVDGHTYERSAITTWLAQHDTSPATNRRLSSRELRPNFVARSAALALRKAAEATP